MTQVLSQAEKYLFLCELLAKLSKFTKRQFFDQGRLLRGNDKKIVRKEGIEPNLRVFTYASRTMLSENFNFVNFPSFAKRSHNSDCCLSLIQDSNLSQVGKSDNFIEKFGLS